MNNAGVQIEETLAVSDIQTASASILVAKERRNRVFHPKVFLDSICLVSDAFQPERIRFIPIHVSSIKAIQ